MLKRWLRHASYPSGQPTLVHVVRGDSHVNNRLSDEEQRKTQEEDTVET
jgi:hypothetical protein